MDKEELITEQPRPHWAIDLDWLEQNNRSFSALAHHCLCTKCRRRFKVSEKEASTADLLATIKDCCSETPGFITDSLPLLESIFRLFLANGNQPLDLEELGKQLIERGHRNVYSTSVEVLSRLLDNDQHYGLCQVTNNKSTPSA